MIPVHGNGRAWVAEIAYPDKKPVWFGTVYAPVEAKEYEVERLAAEKAGEHLPDGFRVVKLMPGSLVFLAGEVTG